MSLARIATFALALATLAAALEPSKSSSKHFLERHPESPELVASSRLMNWYFKEMGDAMKKNPLPEDVAAYPRQYLKDAAGIIRQVGEDMPKESSDSKDSTNPYRLYFKNAADNMEQLADNMSKENASGLSTSLIPLANGQPVIPPASQGAPQWQQNGPPIMYGEPVKPLTWKQYIENTLAAFGIWLLLAVAVYFCCYRHFSPVPERKEDAANAGDPKSVLDKLFNSGHFGCFEDSSICICSFFCPSLRWADTISLAGFLTFWAAFAAITGAVLVNSLLTGSLYGGLISACLLLYYRQQLREKLDIESKTFLTCCSDFCFVCWCPCCAIAQEARILKRAKEMGDDRFTAPPASA